MATIRDRYVLDIDTKGATGGLAGIQGSLGKIGAFAGFAALAAGLGKLAGAAIDASSRLEPIINQLRLITDGQEQLDATLVTLRQNAIATRTSFEEYANVYGKLALATQSLNVSQQDLISVTNNFSKALAISGADTNTAAGAIRQFGQAMASGTVRGDEFNSIVEAIGPALNVMSRETGISVGKLREMSQAGDLTAEAFFNMLKNSQALNNAFNATNATTDQLKVQLSDAFDEVLRDVDQAIGLTENYRGLLIGLTDILRDLAGTSPNLSELVDTEQFTAALANIERQIASNEQALGRMLNLPFNNSYEELEENINALKAQKAELEELIKVQKEEAEATNEAIKAKEEQRRALEATLAPFQKFIDAAKKFVDTDYRGELEKANQRVIDAEIVIQQLRLAFEVTNGKVENFNDLLRAAQSELGAAQNEVKSLTDAAAELGREGTFQKFFEDLITSSQKSSQEVEFAVRAQTRLKEELQAGRISVDEYAFALEGLKSVLGDYSGAAKDAAEDTKRILEQSRAIIDGLNESTSDAQFEFDSLNMSPLKKDIAEIKRDINRDLTQEIKRLQAAMTPENAAQIKSQIELVKQASAEAIRTQTELAERTFETQRSFQYGWSEAFKSYEDDATNAAKNAERIFDKTTKGMEDMIVTFAKTGKFEFKSFVASILEDLLRAQIQQSISNIFKIPTGGGTAGGGLGDIFGGFFANGGFLPGGKLGIVGEAGPELISGPAQITPLSGVGGNVTYNINAVDSMSFKQMVARDPGFIHAVANQGAKAIPGGR